MKERLTRRIAPSLILAIGGGFLLHNIDKGGNIPFEKKSFSDSNSKSSSSPDINAKVNSTESSTSTINGSNNIDSSGKAVNEPPKEISSNKKPTVDNTSNSPETNISTSNVENASPNNSTKVVNGDTFRTRYGNVQVQIKIDNNNKIIDIIALKLPTGENSMYSRMAEPILRSEALVAQSANINFASGASYTSEGYIASLQSAIDKI